MKCWSENKKLLSYHTDNDDPQDVKDANNDDNNNIKSKIDNP